MSLQLKKFDMNSIRFKQNENQKPVCVLIGLRDAGISNLANNKLSTISITKTKECI